MNQPQRSQKFAPHTAQRPGQPAPPKKVVTDATTETPMPLRPRVHQTVSIEELESMVTTPAPAAAVVSTKSQAERDASYLDLTLPSNFHFYPFKSLCARGLRGAEQAKIAAASNEGRLRHLVDAMSATLGDGISAYDLTQEDFHWLMFWQRKHSYGKVPYKHQTICTNQEHLDAVMKQEKDAKTLEIVQVIDKSMVSETIFDPSTVVIPDLGDVVVDTLRVKDMVTVNEMNMEEVTAEMTWLIDRASYLSHKHGDLKARMELVAKMTPDQIADLQVYMSQVTKYGLSESVTVRCKECGASVVSELTIDAQAFLPEVQ